MLLQSEAAEMFNGVQMGLQLASLIFLRVVMRVHVCVLNANAEFLLCGAFRLHQTCHGGAQCRNYSSAKQNASELWITEEQNRFKHECTSTHACQRTLSGTNRCTCMHSCSGKQKNKKKKPASYIGIAELNVWSFYFWSAFTCWLLLESRSLIKQFANCLFSNNIK